MKYGTKGVSMHTYVHTNQKSRGVAMLISNNVDIKVDEKIPHPNGNVLILNASIETDRITRICTY